MMNAARIFAKELKRAEVRRDVQRLASYCHALEHLIDFLYNLTAVNPAWSEYLSLRLSAGTSRNH